MEAEAQAPPPPITSSGLNTQVSAPVNLPSGAVQHDITGGTRPGGGANLFHSFGEFGVPTNNIANFLNDAALPTTNILSRVTGGNPSNIFGAIQTEGFGNANLFLMNPAGIVFGTDALLNVGGATHFTTADYLRLSDGVQFTALPGAQDVLLSIAPVAAFGFLGPNPGAIAVEGSTLSVSEGQTLSLVSGDVTISGSLNAPGGNIAIASVASPGEVSAETYASASNINGDSFTAMGKITLSDGALLDVSNDAAGTVIIRGGELMMTNAVISSDTDNVDGAPVAIDIDVTGDISVSTDARAFTARTTGFGNAGETKLISGGTINISGAGDPRAFFPIFDTHTAGQGNGGNISIASQGDVTITGDLTGESFVFFADTGTDGFDGGKGGDLSITAQNFESSMLTFSTGSLFTFFNGGVGAGPAGNVNISVAGNMNFFFSDIITDSFDFIFETGGNSGDVTLTGRNMNFDRSNISTTGWFRAGNLTINTDSLALSDSEFQTITRTEPGGAVTISGKAIELSGSQIISTTKENANAGDITITATERLLLGNPDGPFNDNISSIASNSFTDDGSANSGAPGTIRINTPDLILNGGSKINSSSGSSGNAGPVLINSDKISISGQTHNLDIDDLRNFGNFQASGIFTGSFGGSCAEACGSSGSVSITTDSLVMNDGAQINSGTMTEGKGGSINVNTAGNISISGTLKDGSSGGVFSRTTGTDQGSGTGGTISLTAGQTVTLSDGATVSASSSGQGNAGDINVTAGDTILLDKATVTTEATMAFGGNIKLTADNQIQLTDSQVTSRVRAGSGSAGSINFDPDFIVLKNSKVLSTAEFGDGGPITLIANSAILIDSFSELNANSQFGGSGTIDLQAPIQNLSGTIVPLPQDPVPVTALYGSRCVAGAGGHFSTFVDSKADSLAPTPGTFLASPFLPLSNLSKSGELGDAGTPSDHATPLQVATYSPPVLFGHGEGMLSACP